MISQLVKNEQQLQDAYSVRKKVFVEEQKVPLELELDEFEESSHHFVIYEGSTPIGAGRFRILGNVGKVERICVLHNFRGRGIGELMMDSIHSFASEQDTIQTLRLHAQVQAIGFYEQLGYKIVSDEFLDAGIPHRTMEKPVS
ncbi:acetyltransferase [Bacillus coahuilensis m2-6]|uniref:Acetyltransferase n=1 Tax=Bacillus coahuilensis p1.1.43 TaxID=1150625 RepID=A0A147KA34_9BACI|nr:GNAT family N-acetyltransferase [Bacillus coahuilensis]KUP07554.1 acetyltransferase [Bacillus coahuilensis p1.1.43]KUP08936.1 acetyltransferase [Bacillus coahuilensis m2-6]